MRRLAHSIVTSAVLLSVACGGGSSPKPEEMSPADQARDVAMSGAAGQIFVPGALFDRPEGWTFREPSSQMRFAEAEVPGPGGPALLTVFFFGPGGGGGTEANLERWAGQIEAEAGTEPVRDTFQVGEFTISTIAVEGTLMPSRMGGGPDQPTPGSELLGAVVEGPEGPWFFKLTGPAETVTAAEPAFEAMLRSVRP